MIEAALTALTEALVAHNHLLVANNELLQKTIDGRAEAINIINTVDKKPRATKDKTAETPKADTAAATTTETPKADTAAATTAPAKKEVTMLDLRATTSAWLGAIDDGPARQARLDTVRAMLDHFGAPKMTDLTGDSISHAAFYVERFKADLPVDFNAEYDFAGDPLTQGAAAPAAEDDLGV